MKKTVVKLLASAATLCFVLALFIFNDNSLVFMGIGIILTAISLREIILGYWEYMKNKPDSKTKKTRKRNKKE